MKLKNLDMDGPKVVYEMGHNNGETTLRQDLQLKRVGTQWLATMVFDDMPKCDTPSEAAKKLGEWMVRMGKAIKENDGKFDTIQLQDIKSS